MWLLHWIPDSLLELFIRSVVITGITSLILGLVAIWIPFAARYGMAARLFGLALLIPGMYFWGGAGVELEYRAATKIWEQKIADAEAKSEQVNTVIVTKIVTETKLIQEDTQETLDEIARLRALVDKPGCELTPDAVKLYNKGVQGGKK